MSSRKVSRSGAVVCPRCEVGYLVRGANDLPRCDFCQRAVYEEVFEYLWQIVSLPDAAGSHACECGHPEMKALPGRIFWCPSCGSEVLPFEPNPA